jgi:hypothetical protein
MQVMSPMRRHWGEEAVLSACFWGSGGILCLFAAHLPMSQIACPSNRSQLSYLFFFLCGDHRDICFEEFSMRFDCWVIILPRAGHRDAESGRALHRQPADKRRPLPLRHDICPDTSPPPDCARCSVQTTQKI